MELQTADLGISGPANLLGAISAPSEAITSVGTTTCMGWVQPHGCNHMADYEKVFLDLKTFPEPNRPRNMISIVKSAF